MGARFFLTAVVVLAALVGCATQAATTRDPEALYLAVEVQDHGKTVGRPKVVGYEGRSITIEKRQPDATAPDYRLVLLPREEGEGYGVRLDLELPSGRKSGRVGLLHGEERRVRLDADIELSVMLMRVDSPEFRALVMQPAARGKSAI
jgi:hypothetical protein